MGKLPSLFLKIASAFWLNGTVMIFSVFICVNSIRLLPFSTHTILSENLIKLEYRYPVWQLIMSQSLALSNSPAVNSVLPIPSSSLSV